MLAPTIGPRWPRRLRRPASCRGPPVEDSGNWRASSRRSSRRFPSAHIRSKRRSAEARAQRKRRLRRCERAPPRKTFQPAKYSNADGVTNWRKRALRPGKSACRPQHERSISPEQLQGVEREQDQFVDPPEIPGAQAVAIAASNMFRHDSVIDRRRLLEGALVEAALQRLGPDQVYAQLTDLEASGALLRLGDEVWTTPAIAACEAAMLRAADRRQERAWFAPAAVKAALDRAAHLTSEQRDAVISATLADGVSIVEAGAGTGKTTLALAIVDAAHASHLHVVGLAPSWVAADELSQSSGIDAVAIARWRYDRDHKGERPLDASTVILVDEAGMVGTRDMSAILTAAKDAGAKVVLIGDRRQLESVAGASALKAVADVVRRGAVLDGVRRQKVEWQRAASVVMARGDTEAGLRAYASRDRVEFVAGDDSGARPGYRQMGRSFAQDMGATC